jgi:hypothetical protein
MEETPIIVRNSSPLISNLVLLTTVRHNPGPGAYEPKDNTDAKGKYFVSSIKNSGAPAFSLPSLPRFISQKQDDVPGPGAYTLKTGISDPAHRFMSSFKSPKTRTFYHCDRKTIEILNDAKSKFIISHIYILSFRLPWSRKL